MHTNTKILITLLIVILIGAFVYTQTLRSKQNEQAIQNTLVSEENVPAPSSVKYETINGVPVPPEPDPELNNATLAGIDVNGNGVRDDVERHMEGKSSSQREFANAMSAAAAYQGALVGQLRNQTDANAYMITISCAAGNTAPILNTGDIQTLVLSTPDRVRTFRLNTSKYAGRLMNPDVNCR